MAFQLSPVAATAVNAAWQAIISTGVGFVFVVLARVIDKFLPDEDNPFPEVKIGKT